MILVALTTNKTAIARSPSSPSVTDGCFVAWIEPDGNPVAEDIQAFYGKTDAGRWFPALPWNQLDYPPSITEFNDEPTDIPPAVVTDSPTAQPEAV